MSKDDFEVKQVGDKNGVSRIFVREHPFLLVVLSPITPTYTLAWTGHLDFDKLDEELFSKLPRAIVGMSNSDFTRIEISGSAKVVVSDPDNEDDLVTINALESEDYRSIFHSHVISFGRFDLQLQYSYFSPESFSFAVGNPKFYTESPKVSIRLSSDREVSPQLWDWIWQCSDMSQELGLDFESTVGIEVLSDVLGHNQGQLLR
ncbi:hypothetical protein GO003_026005 [Methylicorpusculum oleiharenae]|uniref:hypothetical protein n=1 Tax=Methylicorpusculum oleiharenae TaxID=1338687 RepID=UPI0013597DC7|nr:hypothetical protein [Methylicorpusculum oleiharenae]MCD2453833.1 hypothetical protein [Methylicorpusculum oleiharenae]